MTSFTFINFLANIIVVIKTTMVKAVSVTVFTVYFIFFFLRMQGFFCRVCKECVLHL